MSHYDKKKKTIKVTLMIMTSSLSFLIITVEINKEIRRARTADIKTGRQFGKADVPGGVRNFLHMNGQEHHYYIA